MSGNGQPSDPRLQSPAKKLPSVVKSELAEMLENGQEQHSEVADSPLAHLRDMDDHMDYDDETPVHPLAPAPQTSTSPNMYSPTTPRTQHSPYLQSLQPQQHQQLLKLKSEHGFPGTPSPVSTPDIVMTSNDSNDQTSADAVAASSEPAPEGDSQHEKHQQQEMGHSIVDTSFSAVHTAHEVASEGNSDSTPVISSLTVDAPTTAGTTAPSSRRPSLRTMTATLPRSALQEETIALFKQYRNLIPCAKCFCRNTIQRDGMSDGNLRFKCRPPVSMSLICNKSYSESKIRNMIAGVVYGHSLPDSSTPGSATSPGDNVLALAPPPAVKTPRRASTKAEGSPRIGSEVTSDRTKRMDKEQESNQAHDERQTDELPHSIDSRRPSLSHHFQQGSSSRRGSLQPPPRRPSMSGDESTMMDYDDPPTQLPPSNHSGHLQIPGTPPMDSEDPRLYRSRSSYGHQGPTGTQPPLSTAGRQIHKLHHSHSHPNIGQQRHQQYLEQQEREQRGTVSGLNYSNQQQQQQRPVQRQVVRRGSSQYHGGADRRSSHPSPVLNVAGSKYMGEAPSPALSSSPRSPPGRESTYHQQNTGPSSSSAHDSVHTPVRAHSVGGRYDDNSAASYFQRRMSQPHPSHAYSNGHPGLPPPLPSPLSHPYDRRASEVDEYPQMHREKYERLNANTMIAPSSAMGPSRHQPPQQPQQKFRPHYPSGSPNGGMETRQHPLDVADQTDDTSRQALTPPMRSSQHQSSGSSNPASTASSPWMNGSGSNYGVSHNLAAPQAEPMRYSHSMPMGQGKPPLRHHYSSSSLYYQTPRQEDRERFDNENDRDMSPDYQDIDGDGRPIARARPQGLKRKSLGQPLSRSSSNQNLYSTSVQQHQYQCQSPHQLSPSSLRESSDPRDLNAAMPRSSIKMTCFPNSQSKPSTNALPKTKTLDTSKAIALQLNQSSKIVIEIRQPRSLQSYSSASNLRNHSKDSSDINGDSSSVLIQRSNSHPDILLDRSTSSVLGYRRSPSPDGTDFGSSLKKRRADSDSASPSDTTNEDLVGSLSTGLGLDAAAAAAAAAAVAAVTAAAAAVTSPPSIPTSAPAVQVFGMNYLAKSNDTTLSNSKRADVGLGLSQTSNPSLEAFRVAKGSSYVLLEDQQEMGIDYSLFTRVETAGWRILIPPNVVASFHSEDFGLMLKPKGVEDIEDEEERTNDLGGQREATKEAVMAQEGQQQQQQQTPGDIEEEEEDVNVEGVSRIALRDDDKEDELDDTSRTVGASSVIQGQKMIQDDEDQEMEIGEHSSISVADTIKRSSPTGVVPRGAVHGERQQEQEDIAMDKEEQDELLEDV
ncbi:hypothetical protein BC939DRAFT_505831 [Gamsiella multidivaricata]|uniref:uncharacterized protein n=1 Tax=Gamsiella multidivaricata TaxID=101098 RepID=UPI002221294C|nr:uncharacterized protein BC939DRAFT_505831 [Gamsiella multidivaricata]KAI7819318.1 hypothetical protein BC939DRAFT_505831 [Gamsiella multidivaricata]